MGMLVTSNVVSELFSQQAENYLKFYLETTLSLCARENFLAAYRRVVHNSGAARLDTHSGEPAKRQVHVPGGPARQVRLSSVSLGHGVSSGNV